MTPIEIELPHSNAHFSQCSSQPIDPYYPFDNYINAISVLFLQLHWMSTSNTITYLTITFSHAFLYLFLRLSIGKCDEHFLQ